MPDFPVTVPMFKLLESKVESLQQKVEELGKLLSDFPAKLAEMEKKIPAAPVPATSGKEKTGKYGRFGR